MSQPRITLPEGTRPDDTVREFFWRVRCQALERLVETKSPAVMNWFRLRERAIWSDIIAWPKATAQPAAALVLVALYLHSLPVPRSLRGFGRKARRPNNPAIESVLQDPDALVLLFEAICHNLQPFWRGRRGPSIPALRLVDTIVNPLCTTLGTPLSRVPTVPQVRQWIRQHRTVKAFATRLLAHISNGGREHLRKTISRARVEIRAGRRLDVDLLSDARERLSKMGVKVKPLAR